MSDAPYTIDKETYDYASGMLTLKGCRCVAEWLRQGDSYPCATCRNFEVTVLPYLLTMVGVWMQQDGKAKPLDPSPIGMVVSTKCSHCKEVRLYQANDIFDGLVGF